MSEPKSAWAMAQDYCRVQHPARMAVEGNTACTVCLGVASLAAKSAAARAPASAERDALVADLRPLIGAHADITANHLLAAGWTNPAHATQPAPTEAEGATA